MYRANDAVGQYFTTFQGGDSLTQSLTGNPAIVSMLDPIKTASAALQTWTGQTPDKSVKHVPSAADLAKADSLTEEGKRLLHASNPDIAKRVEETVATYSDMPWQDKIVWGAVIGTLGVGLVLLGFFTITK